MTPFRYHVMVADELVNDSLDFCEPTFGARNVALVGEPSEPGDDLDTDYVRLLRGLVDHRGLFGLAFAYDNDQSLEGPLPEGLRFDRAQPFLFRYRKHAEAFGIWLKLRK
jgi:hypothetical protein